MNEKAIAIRQEQGVINYEDPKMIETLKATVAQGANNEEFAMFAQFCKATGLNPFKKEIWFIKVKRKKQNEVGAWVEAEQVQMMTGINGYLAIANAHPAFDGMETEPTFDKNGNLLSATCRVYRKDRSRPSVGVALMQEFQGTTPIWKQKPFVMLSKVAKSIALREAFPQELNGLYTEEEDPTADVPAPTQREDKPKVEIDPPRTWAYELDALPKNQQGEATRLLRKANGKKEADGFIWTFDEVKELEGICVRFPGEEGPVITEVKSEEAVQ